MRSTTRQEQRTNRGTKRPLTAPNLEYRVHVCSLLVEQNN
jgi:hypothetical protein